MAEAKIKAERIRSDSERELAAATQRRDSINAQLTNVRQMLATLGGVAMIAPIEEAAAVPDETGATTDVESHDVVTDAQDGENATEENTNASDESTTDDNTTATDTTATDNEPVTSELTVEAPADGETDVNTDDNASDSTDVNSGDNSNGHKSSGSGHKVGSKR